MEYGEKSVQKKQLDALERLSPEAFRDREKLPLYLVLDNVRSGLNIGSVFRTCDAFAVQELLLVGLCATPPHKEILKTALGSSETVSWNHFPDAEACLSYLVQKGASVYAVEQTDQSIGLEAFVSGPISFPMALVLGNEVSGVSEAFLRQADGILEIPQFGTKHSLNVAVCAGIVAWEMAAAYFLRHDLPDDRP
jgi:23S rRNA (guanosine2251-2'-O)-methyltransferase